MILVDVAQHLVAGGPWVEGSTTYPVRYNVTTDIQDPDTDVSEDAQIVLATFIPPGKQKRAMGGHLVRENAGLRVIVRGPKFDPENAVAMAQQVYEYLDGTSVTINTREHWFEILHAPVLDEQDRNGRWKVFIRFKVLREQG